MKEKDKIRFNTKVSRKTTVSYRESNAQKTKTIDAHFYKYWPENMNKFISSATSTERRFFDWLVQNKLRAKDNQIEATYKEISNEAGIGLRFVEKTMKKLMDTDVIVKVRNGVYIVNPDILFKGVYYARQEAVRNYQASKDQMKKKKHDQKVKKEKSKQDKQKKAR